MLMLPWLCSCVGMALLSLFSPVFKPSQCLRSTAETWVSAESSLGWHWLFLRRSSEGLAPAVICEGDSSLGDRVRSSKQSLLSFADVDKVRRRHVRSLCRKLDNFASRLVAAVIIVVETRGDSDKTSAERS